VRCRAALGDAEVVVNPDWATGMGSSLRAGLRALATTPAVAAVVLLVDTPGITPAAVARLRARGGPAALAVATYRGERGHPVLLGRAHWTGAAALAAGDVGARPYLHAHAGLVTAVACEDVADGADLDVPPALAAGSGQTADHGAGGTAGNGAGHGSGDTGDCTGEGAGHGGPGGPRPAGA
jgi:nicotine blue oxidoreductase